MRSYGWWSNPTLPAKQTLDTLCIPRTTFYRWYDRYMTGGPEALEDRTPKPSRVWNRIPDDIRSRIVALALAEPELSLRELAVRFTDTQKYFVSEASVYRLLKAQDLITSPAFVVIKAADKFRDKLQSLIRCGRQTSPTSRSSAGAGITSPPFWTTSRDMLSPESCARQ